MKKIWFKSALVALAGMSVSSCGDFLDIYPLTMVYEDNYWNEKNDVDQIVAGCYTRMQDDDFMRRLFIWGEVRSDNVGRGYYSKYNGASPEADILNENILSTNVYTDWSPFYSVIDRCNLVIERAPQVAAVDPSYLESDMNATIAEVSALRALCYFYLVRTFKDVPYYTYAITNDEQPLDLEVTKGDEIIRYLIEDLTKVHDQALTAWPSQNGQDVSYARITQNAIDALLADMYLWIGDYANAAERAQRVLKSKTEYFEGRYSSSLMVDGYPLIPDNGTVVQPGTAYNYNFGSGGGPESIFELEFSSSTTDGSKSNTMVPALFRRFLPEKDLPADYGYFGPERGLWDEWGSATVFASNEDSRVKESIWLDDASDPSVACIAKYAYSAIYPRMENDLVYASGQRLSKNDANWVFYRVSDMMLIRAEALICQMSDNGSERDAELADEAFQLIDAVEARSSRNTTSSLDPDDYVSRNSLLNLVYLERRREFMFEGKRWFDLVRRTRQEGNDTDYLVQQIRNKFNTATATSKFGHPDAIYWPYNYDELRVNDNLQQNPAYPDSDNSSYESTAE